MEKRKCVKCGKDLTEEDLMKPVFEDSLSEILLLPTYSGCFWKQMLERAIRKEQNCMSRALSEVNKH